MDGAFEDWFGAPLQSSARGGQRLAQSPPSRHRCLLIKVTRARIAALPAEQIEHAPHRFLPELRRAIRQHVLRPAALFTRSAFLIFGSGELTPTARASKLPATDNQFSSL